MQRQKVWARRATSVLLALVLGLVLAEILARSCTRPVGPPPRGEGEILVESAMARRGWELVPGARMRLIYPAPDGSERSVDHDIGPHGWRGRPFAARKRPGSVRIACVGDSHTFGWGVDESLSWPAQLERLLRERGYDVEVLNLGVPNTNLEEKAYVVEHVALESDCDIVALQLHFDDNALDGISLGRRNGHAWAPTHPRPRQSEASAVFDWMCSHLVSVELVAEGLRRQRASKAYVVRHTAAMRTGHPARERVDKSLAELRSAALARGATLAAFVYPLPVRTGSGWASDALDEQWLEATRRAGIDVMSLAKAFDACEGDVCVHPFDPHVNAEAQLAAAVATIEFFVERGLFSQERVDEWRNQRNFVHEGEYQQGR